MANKLGLVGDIGGTNARFALVEKGRVIASSIYTCANQEYPYIGQAIQAYLTKQGAPKVTHACLALASAMMGDAVKLTNYDWSFSQKTLCEELGLKQLMLVNDFTALAMGVPLLTKDQYYAVGGGEAQPHQSIGVVGAGTGFGVSGLLWDGRHWVAIEGEGGHVSFAPTNELEIEILRVGIKSYGRVSAERLVSGAGLEFLYRALLEIKGITTPAMKAADIAAEAVQNAASLSHEAVNIFCGVLGSVAGDLALTLGARGGVFIGGGIVPRLGKLVHASPLRARFEDKGRFKNYVSAIPTYVITNSEQAALAGAATILNEH